MRRTVAVSIAMTMGVFAACGDPESQGPTEVTQPAEAQPAPNESATTEPSEVAATTDPAGPSTEAAESTVDAEPAGTTADVGAPTLAVAVAGQRVDLCGGLAGELPDDTQTFESLVSSGGVTLVAVVCEWYAYQMTYAFAGWDGTELFPMQVEQWSGGALVDSPLVLGYPVVEAAGRIANLEKARGVGDCGQYQAWEFTGRMVLLEARERSCDVGGEYTEPDTWDLVYPVGGEGSDGTDSDPFPTDGCIDETTALGLARTEYPDLDAVTVDLCTGPIAVGSGFLPSGDVISVAFVENGSWQFLAGSFGYESICQAVWAIDPGMDVGCGATDATGWLWPYSTYFDVPQLGEEPVRGSGCGVSGQLGDTIPDGVWNGYARGLTATTLQFDVACVYYGDLAEQLIDEHLATIPPDEILGDYNPSYWIVNSSERVREVPVSWDFTSRAAVWTDVGCEDPGPGEDDYLPTGWIDSWLIIENGEAVFLLESCHYG